MTYDMTGIINEYESAIQEVDQESAKAPQKTAAYEQMIAFLSIDHPELEKDLHTAMDEQAAQIRQKRLPGGDYEHYDELQGRSTQEYLFIQECSTLLHTLHMSQYIAHVTQQRRAR